MEITLEHEWDIRSVDFPLTDKSTVLDIGGFKGRWANEIAIRFNPHLYVFEPQPWAAEICRQVLKSYSGSKVFEFALGVQDGTFPMEEFETDGCTFLTGRSGRLQFGEGKMVEMLPFLEKKRIRKIDVCMMNIEGYEFQLIPYMLRNGIFDHIRYFMCQFHPYGHEEEVLYDQIRDDLYSKMDYFFDYGRTLTCWVRK